MEQVRIVEEKGRIEIISGEGVTWVNVVKPSRQELNFLAQLYPFHPLDLDDCVSKIQLPKIDEYEDYLFIILHFPRFIKEKQITIRSQVAIFLGRNYLVTVHQGDLKPLNELFEACKNNEQKQQEILNKDPGFLLYRIIDNLVDYLFPIIDKIFENLDKIEDKVFDEKIEAVREVTILRRDIADQRRIIYPLRRVIIELEKKAQRFTKENLSVYFSDVSDHIEKVWEALEECKEMIEIYKDTDFMLTTEKTNKILAVLTILFTLTIPAVTIGTFYGMNINLPGGIETGAWTFLGPYTTLILILIASLIPAGIMAWFFRRWGWI